MPIYEYRCDDCGHEFEALVRTDALPQCPECESGALDKKLSVFAAPGAQPEPAAVGPCGNCCHHPDGPGGCSR